MRKVRTYLVSAILLIASAVLIIYTLFSIETKRDLVLKNLKVMDNAFLSIPNNLKSKLDKDVTVLIIIKDLSCPLCLNEVVDIADFITSKREYSNRMNIAIWYTDNDESRIQNYHDSVDRDVPFSFGELALTTNNKYNFGNSIFFISNNNEKVMSYIPLSVVVMPTNIKDIIYGHVVKQYDNNR